MRQKIFTGNLLIKLQLIFWVKKYLIPDFRIICGNCAEYPNVSGNQNWKQCRCKSNNINNIGYLNLAWKMETQQFVVQNIYLMIWTWRIVLVVWLTDERRLALFPAGTTVRDPHHRESLTRRKQDLNLCRTWVQSLMKLHSSNNH